jgi:hypothetical protein
MAATAGYSVSLMVGGTPTTFTSEATTELDAGPPQVFQLTSATKQSLDPATAIVIRDNTLADVTDDFQVDYLAGTFTSPTGGYTSISVSGKFIPRSSVAQATAATINASIADLDSSALGNSFTTLVLGKASAEGELSIIASQDAVLDGDAQTWRSIFEGRAPVLLEATFAGRRFRAWVRLLRLGSEIDQGGLMEGSFPWKSVSRVAIDGTEVCFSFTDA